MNEQQESLYDFVKIMHKGQLRKYTNEPYHNHLLRVAEMAGSYGVRFGIEIGLCHDLLEDTDCDYSLLRSFLKAIGYSGANLSFIMNGVEALTDVYNTEAYNFNRSGRKRLEAERLWTIDPVYQSVKYCDLIDNTSSIVEYDPKFAVKYLEEKKYILNGMHKGHPELFNIAVEILEASQPKHSQ